MVIRRVAPVVLFVAGLFPATLALAAPVPASSPKAGAVATARGPAADAFEHRVARGERLQTIANRYGVTVDDLVNWNQLDPKHPRAREGQLLHVRLPYDPQPRRRSEYVVRPGDTWTKIAQRLGIQEERLRRHWNPGLDELRPGDRLTLWQSAERPTHSAPTLPAPLSTTATDANLQADVERPLLVSTVTRVAPSQREAISISSSTVTPSPIPQPRIGRKFSIVSVPMTALSVGSPGHGRLRNGIQLPVNEPLYTIRNPDHSWCSSHLIEYLQRAIASFRETTGFDRLILIQDTSQRTGGHFSPHVSHRQGRDVDIQLPMRAGISPKLMPTRMNMVDWDATWQLVRAFVGTGNVKYIFLSRSRQLELYRAAKRSGASEAEIHRFIQYPHGSPAAVVRHSEGHVKHFHVRFTCAPYETECRD